MDRRDDKFTIGDSGHGKWIIAILLVCVIAFLAMLILGRNGIPDNYTAFEVLVRSQAGIVFAVILLVYFVGALYSNRTTALISGDVLRLSYGPMPWPGVREVGLRDINAVLVTAKKGWKHQLNRGNYATLYLRLASGRKRAIYRGLITKDEGADFAYSLTSAINRQLGAESVAVEVLEYGPWQISPGSLKLFAGWMILGGVVMGTAYCCNSTFENQAQEGILRYCAELAEEGTAEDARERARWEGYQVVGESEDGIVVKKLYGYLPFFGAYSARCYECSIKWDSTGKIRQSLPANYQPYSSTSDGEVFNCGELEWEE